LKTIIHKSIPNLSFESSFDSDIYRVVVWCAAVVCEPHLTSDHESILKSIIGNPIPKSYFSKFTYPPMNSRSFGEIFALLLDSIFVVVALIFHVERVGDDTRLLLRSLKRQRVSHRLALLASGVSNKASE